MPQKLTSDKVHRICTEFVRGVKAIVFQHKVCVKGYVEQIFAWPC